MLTKKEKQTFSKYAFWQESAIFASESYDPCSVGGPTCGCETGCKCSVGCGGPERQKNDHETPLLNL